MIAFRNLSKKRQDEILNEAMDLFGRLGYKKTSMNDIAKSINVSKSMVFKYFKSKKQMYLNLVIYASNLVIDGLNQDESMQISDFFERIESTTINKIKILKQHPNLMSFLTSVYFEEDEEVYDDLKLLFKEMDHIKEDFVLSDIDREKFKDDVNPEIVLKMLTRIGEGYSKVYKEDLDLDVIVEEYKEYLRIMKQNFYKKEYL